MTFQYAIPLAGRSPAFRAALPLLLASTALEYDHDIGDMYVELAAHQPSEGQRLVWTVALSLGGFGVVDLYDVMNPNKVDAPSRAAVVAAINAAHEAMTA